MEGKFLDHRLECPVCGVIRLTIPADLDDRAVVACWDCGTELGTWGELQGDFYRQSGAEAFDLKDGRIKEVLKPKQ